MDIDFWLKVLSKGFSEITDLCKYKTLTDFMWFGLRVSAYMHSGYSRALYILLEIPIYGTTETGKEREWVSE